MKTETHKADICVVGGGLAGMCAALSAARHGCKVVLIHDRPVFGGNCSSEIRMWPLGAHGSSRRETGIFEEIVLENMRVNPMRSWSVWDAVLYNFMNNADNLTVVMNCSVNSLEVKKAKICSVTGWQLTTYTTHKVFANKFVDCSGDSILALLSGAEIMKGREPRDKYNEEAAPEAGDGCTMGNSLMLQARESNAPVTYTPPCRIRKISEKDLMNRCHDLTKFREGNFWWIELGGELDTLADCEKIKNDLIKLSFGVWDHIKNEDNHGADNWVLDWAGFLPGKRESYRCKGDYVLTQNDVSGGTQFDDIIAYGGWSIDNHPPLGFNHKGEPTRYFKSESPFGIPYRCIYSKNIENLMFAGRNISVSHCALAASRVMATCAVLGQAAGTAAALSEFHSTSPRGMGEHIEELQQTLMYDDCWIPGHMRKISEICRSAKLTAACSNAENLRNGIDRPTDDGGDNGCFIPLGTDCVYRLEKPSYVSEVRIVFDSDLDRITLSGGIPSLYDCPTICNRPLNMKPFGFPTTMTDTFEVCADGEVLRRIEGNRQRCVILKINKTVRTLALKPVSTCGDTLSHIFSFDFK